MTIQMSTGVRNARLDVIESTIGPSARLRLYSGATPATCAAAETGVLLVEIALAPDWSPAAASGVKALTTPVGAAAVASGIAGHFRIYDSGGLVCHYQGSVSGGGSGDMNLDNANIAINQNVSVLSFSISEGNA